MRETALDEKEGEILFREEPREISAFAHNTPADCSPAGKYH